MDLKKWGEQIKERDANICQLCKCEFKASWLIAHHVVPTRIGGKNTIDNGETLCPPCHKKIHSLLKLNHIPRHENAVDLADETILSGRETQILRYFCIGYGPSETARHIGLSVKTISTYRGRMLKKLKLRNTTELLLYGIKIGLCRTDLKIESNNPEISES